MDHRLRWGSSARTIHTCFEWTCHPVAATQRHLTRSTPIEAPFENIDLISAVRSAPVSIQARGRRYCAEGRVHIETCGEGRATARVEGNSSVPYIVKITLDQRNSTRRILVSCTCPYARDWPGEFCKHHVAAILELANHLNRRPKKIDWRTTLQDALDERLPGKKPSRESSSGNRGASTGTGRNVGPGWQSGQEAGPGWLSERK